MFRRFFTFSVCNPKFDVALLLLRIGIGTNLFLRHGVEKIHGFSIPAHFSNDIGIGETPTFLIAFFGDAICSLLLVLGIGTRWIAMYYFCLISVAWGVRHHFMYWDTPGHHLSGDHGELIVCYLLFMVLLFLTGPGRYSVDAWIAGSKKGSNSD